MKSNTHIAVVGAGIVGISCALWLQQKGFKVTLVDGNEPGSGASSGNACTIASYACIPINSPALLRQLPHLLISRDSPLSIDPIYALLNLPWMFSFLKSCGSQKVHQIINSLGTLLALTNQGLDPLIKWTETADQFAHSGFMQVYQNQHSFEQARKDNQIRAEHGARFTELNTSEIKELEPGLKFPFEKGLLYEGIRHVLDPEALVRKFFRCFIDAGGGHVADHAHGVIHNPDGMKIFMHNKKFLRANKIVISNSAFSHQIEGCAVERIPLVAEREYNIQYAGKQNLLNRPVGWYEGGFYATPVSAGLRLAGTTEISGLRATKNTRRIAYLTRKSRQMFGIQDNPDSDWLGFRPILSDSLPVIGISSKSPNTFYAFGHQHMELPLAGITGKIIADLIAEEKPDINLQPFSADRFRRRNSIF